MRLSPKTAFNRLVQGKKLYHQSVEGVDSVKMIKGKLVSSQGVEWSFSDFNNFHDSKRDFVTYKEYISILEKTHHEGYLELKESNCSEDELRGYVKGLIFEHPDYEYLEE